MVQNEYATVRRLVWSSYYGPAQYGQFWLSGLLELLGILGTHNLVSLVLLHHWGLGRGRQKAFHAVNRDSLRTETRGPTAVQRVGSWPGGGGPIMQ